jgi:signal transduction histidine kinase
MEQRMFEANRQLKKLNEDKDNLLGVVAHDLKSPLNGIIGLLNLLKLTLSAMEPEQQEYFRYIEHSCINMSALVNNLLDIGRIELGRNEINPERVELGVLLKQHIKIFEEQAERKKITIILEDNAPAVTLTTDPKVLTRIMENLISNAIKFSPHEKQILIRVIHNAANIKVEVKDQGPGIAKEELPDLFKKYQRLSAKPTGGESSTGLGLSIVKELVSYLDGKISVESDRNAGATFILELPMLKDDEIKK